MKGKWYSLLLVGLVLILATFSGCETSATTPASQAEQDDLRQQIDRQQQTLNELQEQQEAMQQKMELLEQADKYDQVGKHELASKYRERADAWPLTLKIISITSPVNPGGQVILNAQTLPGAECTIVLYYRDDPSLANDLSPKLADDLGNVSWNWHVPSTLAAIGYPVWPVGITAKYNGKHLSVQTRFATQ